MSYTNEELDRFLASDDAQENKDGSITWAKDNVLGMKPGTWLSRPPQAAPLITSETGVEFAKIRRERRREAMEEGFAIGVGNVMKEVLTTDEALAVFTAMVAKAAMDSGRKDFSRLASMLFEMLEAKPQKKVEIDQRTQKIDVSASEINILTQSPAIQRLFEQKDA